MCAGVAMRAIVSDSLMIKQRYKLEIRIHTQTRNHGRPLIVNEVYSRIGGRNLPTVAHVRQLQDSGPTRSREPSLDSSFSNTSVLLVLGGDIIIQLQKDEHRSRKAW